MDVTVFVQIVSNLGVPVACLVAMFWMLNKEREDHKLESDKFVEAINNNTVVRTKLVERMEQSRQSPISLTMLRTKY